MKLIDRLVWRELFGPLINSIFMFLMLLFAAAYLFTVTDYLVRGVPVLTVGKMALYSLPMLVTQTLPMSVLLASLLSFGRLSGDSEHVAAFASGISFYRMVLPVAWLGLIVSVFAFAWNESVVPPATREFTNLKQSAVEEIVTSNQRLSYNVKEGDRIDESVNVEGGYDPKSGWFRDVMIIKMSDDPKRKGQADFYVFADRARPRSDDPKGLDWDYQGVRIVDLRPEPNRKYWMDTYVREANTRSLPPNVGMRQPFRGVLRAERPDTRSMTFRELRDRIKEERARGSLDTLGDEVDLWGKISTPLASLIFGLVGAPLGVRPHRGTKAMGFGIAIGIIFLYWVIYNWMYVVGKNGGLPPLFASFTPNLIGVVAAVWLIGRTRQ